MQHVEFEFCPHEFEAHLCRYFFPWHWICWKVSLQVRGKMCLNNFRPILWCVGIPVFQLFNIRVCFVAFLRIFVKMFTPFVPKFNISEVIASCFADLFLLSFITGFMTMFVSIFTYSEYLLSFSLLSSSSSFSSSWLSSSSY